MSKIQIKDIWLFVAQVLLLSLVLLSPGLISYVTTNDATMVWSSLWISAYWLAPAVVVYLLNFYLCVPILWFRHRYWLFGLANVILILVCNSHLLFKNISSLPDIYRAGYSSFMIIALLVNLMAIGIAMSIRYVMRQGEKKQKEVEAELAWLKNQINPVQHRYSAPLNLALGQSPARGYESYTSHFSLFASVHPFSIAK